MTLSVFDRIAPAVAADQLDDEPLALPAVWTPPHRPGIPLVASIVPVVGAVAMWAFTGSAMALWLAGLGPLVAIASAVDGRRALRRDRARAERESETARSRVRVLVERRHVREREELWVRHPDVARFCAGGDAVWRALDDRDDALVVGSGQARSAVRVTGGEGDAASAELRTRAAALADAPLVVPLSAGVAVVGPDVLAQAVVRALVLQACHALPPGRLRIAGATPEHPWLAALPHARVGQGRALAVVGAGEPVPADADAVIVRLRAADPVPPRCAAVLTVEAPGRARIEHGGALVPLAVEAVSAVQAGELAEALSARAAATAGLVSEELAVVPLAALLPQAPPPCRGGLPAVIGAGPQATVVDLVADGPHAVVAGVTGSGKSELLTSWIVALCATHTPDEVVFLLADFKGGTAFEPLTRLPHVTGVLTDLDGAGARRALESLRAELRRREAALAALGARDVLDPRADLPRLVVVVDEFAALVGDHPELAALFADVAARGRALGMHLILGTQRVAGVIRDAVLANCPLRISLRVTDPSDSRAVIGTDDAARLPGQPSERGLALVRRGSDASPSRTRVALTADADIAAIVARTPLREPPRRPWLPPLPTRIGLDALERASSPLLLGLADEPARQRQSSVGFSWGDRGVLVVGAPGSGRTSALTTLGAQALAQGRLEWVPSDPEAAWDALDRLAEQSTPPETLVIVDDLDALLTRYPTDVAFGIVERLERVLRAAGSSGSLVVASTVRLGGLVSRLADLFPRRVVLPTASRADHAAAGGEAAQFSPGAPPGRARVEGIEVQVALAAMARPVVPQTAPTWHPQPGLSGAVLRRSPAGRAAVEAWAAGGARVATVDELANGAVSAVGGTVVVAGDPDEWQRQWKALSLVRADHPLLIDAGCQAELRLLLGALPTVPYCEPGRGRALLTEAGGPLRRVGLPGVPGGADRRLPGA